MRQYNPKTVAAPAGAYSHAIGVPANARSLYVSGQVGIDKDGNLGCDVGEQTHIVWQNISLILQDAGMELADIVKVTAYLTDPADLPAYGKARSEILGDARPCSTLLFVSALVHPEWKIEVEVVAAKEE
ncbi:MAG: RidA family protein [Rhizobiales bacterium]|nr:RidA family protein [Hyphomicrobiales bacterium]